MSTSIIVVDLDGTLCDSSHRDHLAQAGDWEGFHQACERDEIHRDVAFLITKLFDTGVKVIICTGRNERYRGVTIKWLMKNDLARFVDSLLMRPDGDFRPDIEVKSQALFSHLQESFFVKREEAAFAVRFILDDRDRVVSGWRDLGFNCWQVRQGTF